MQHYIVTGATGLLGSHIIYELVKLKLSTDNIGEIIILARSKNGTSARERFNNIFNPELRPDYLSAYDNDEPAKQCRVIDCDLRDLSSLSSEEIPSDSVLIHAGSSVNLGTDVSTHEEILHNNYTSTINLFETLSAQLSTFVFISTAFSSGHREGKIDNDFLIRKDNKYRNHYERFKSKLEKELCLLCNRKNIQHKIFRPSVICGRLTDTPKFVINKFLVFYLFGSFFNELVRKNKTQLPVRIHLSRHASLNIIPVDYVAKVIVVAAADVVVTQLNIVSKEQTSLEKIMKIMLDKVDFPNYSFVYTEPENLNINEKNYYRWIGSQLHTYIHTPAHYFDTTLLEKILPQPDEMNILHHFEPLFQYAISKKFKNE